MRSQWSNSEGYEELSNWDLALGMDHDSNTHALADPHVPGVSHWWCAGLGLNVKGGVEAAHSSAGEWTPPVGLALPQVGDTHLCADLSNGDK